MLEYSSTEYRTRSTVNKWIHLRAHHSRLSQGSSFRKCHSGDHIRLLWWSNSNELWIRLDNPFGHRKRQLPDFLRCFLPVLMQQSWEKRVRSTVLVEVVPWCIVRYSFIVTGTHFFHCRLTWCQGIQYHSIKYFDFLVESYLYQIQYTWLMRTNPSTPKQIFVPPQNQKSKFSLETKNLSPIRSSTNIFGR